METKGGTSPKRGPRWRGILLTGLGLAAVGVVGGWFYFQQHSRGADQTGRTSRLDAAPAVAGPGETGPWNKVISVRDDGTEAMATQIMAQVLASREKLRTLHVAGTQRVTMFDSDAKGWIDYAPSKGKLWFEGGVMGRERDELNLVVPWTGTDVPGNSTRRRSTIVWDGTTTRELVTRDGGFSADELPRLTVSAVRTPSAVGSGMNASAALWQYEGSGKDDEWITGYELSDSNLGWAQKHGRQVTFDDGRQVMELEVRKIAEKYPETKTIYERYWFDEKRGFSLVGYEWGHDDGKLIMQIKVDELKEIVPGVFYPVKWRSMDYNRGVADQMTQETLDVVEINRAMDDQRFTLDVPEGTHVEYLPDHYAGKPPASRPAGVNETNPATGLGFSASQPYRSM